MEKPNKNFLLKKISDIRSQCLTWFGWIEKLNKQVTFVNKEGLFAKVVSGVVDVFSGATDQYMNMSLNDLSL